MACRQSGKGKAGNSQMDECGVREAIRSHAGHRPTRPSPMVIPPSLSLLKPVDSFRGNTLPHRRRTTSKKATPAPPGHLALQWEQGSAEATLRGGGGQRGQQPRAVVTREGGGQEERWPGAAVDGAARWSGGELERQPNKSIA